MLRVVDPSATCSSSSSRHCVAQCSSFMSPSFQSVVSALATLLSSFTLFSPRVAPLVLYPRESATPSLRSSVVCVARFRSLLLPSSFAVAQSDVHPKRAVRSRSLSPPFLILDQTSWYSHKKSLYTCSALPKDSEVRSTRAAQKQGKTGPNRAGNTRDKRPNQRDLLRSGVLVNHPLWEANFIINYAKSGS